MGKKGSHEDTRATKGVSWECVGGWSVLGFVGSF